MNTEKLFIDGKLTGDVLRRYKDTYGWHFVLASSTNKVNHEIVVPHNKIKSFTSCKGLRITTVENITGEKALEILKVLKESAETVDALEDSYFEHDRNTAKYSMREIIETLLNLNLED